MRLDMASMLEGVADALRDQVSPQLPEGFACEAARMAQSLILIAARSLDDAAAIRVRENAVIRALLDRGAKVVADPGLARRLERAAGSADPGLRISELDAETGRLRLLLVELHAAVESDPLQVARALDQDIWRAMAETERDRAPRA